MFRFTIRELVLLTLVVATCVGWWLDRRHLATESARWKWRFGEVADRFSPMGWSIYTDSEGVGIGNTNNGHDHTYWKDPF